MNDRMLTGQLRRGVDGLLDGVAAGAGRNLEYLAMQIRCRPRQLRQLGFDPLGARRYAILRGQASFHRKRWGTVKVLPSATMSHRRPELQVG